MARAQHICPACTQPVGRQHRKIGEARYHLDCSAPVGRPPTTRGRGSRQVVVRVSDEQGERLDADATAQETTPAELLRRAYFGR